MLSKFQLTQIEEELKLSSGLKVNLHIKNEKYVYTFVINNKVTLDKIYPHDLEVDRQRSVIRIIRDRHPELFL